MRTSKISVELVTITTVDKGCGEVEEKELNRSYIANRQKIWASRNDTLRINGAPIIKYRLLVKNTALYDLAGQSDPLNALKYARVSGVKYNVVSLSQDPTSLNVVVELGGIIA